MVKGQRENGSREVTYPLPDMAFIRSKIPISEVAFALGLKLGGRSTAHCWRTQQHQNGDRTPSISLRKNRATCYVCDGHPLSSIDLVMAHQQCDLISAVRWICARFDVPNIPKGKKLVRSERWRTGRFGASRFPLEEIIRSGIWANLSDAERAVLPVLCCFADANTGEVEISYRGIARYSGKSTNNTVSAVIAKLEKLGLLKVTRNRDGTFRKCGRYLLDWSDGHFQDALRSCNEATRAERDLERTLRAQRRLLKSNTLSTVVHCQQTAHSTLPDRGVSAKGDGTKCTI